MLKIYHGSPRQSRIKKMTTSNVKCTDFNVILHYQNWHQHRVRYNYFVTCTRRLYLTVFLRKYFFLGGEKTLRLCMRSSLPLMSITLALIVTGNM